MELIRREKNSTGKNAFNLLLTLMVNCQLYDPTFEKEIRLFKTFLFSDYLILLKKKTKRNVEDHFSAKIEVDE